jgi:xylulose-5-phosphate/fructose-6-phosphate phosphoketolase
MTVLNQVDRYDLAMDVIDHVPRLRSTSGPAREHFKNKLIEHRLYIRSHGEDPPEIREWQFTGGTGPRAVTASPERNAPEA